MKWIILILSIPAVCFGQEFQPASQFPSIRPTDTPREIARLQDLYRRGSMPVDEWENWHQASMARSPQGNIGETDYREYPSVAIVSIPGGKGSGVLLDGGLVLTAHHVVRGSSQATVKFPATAETCQGRVATYAIEFDLAIIAVPKNLRARPAMIARDEPQRGETITVAGWGGSPRRGFFATAGRLIRQILRPRGYQISTPVSFGDSGGPVFNSRGEVVGVNSTSDLRTISNSGGTAAKIRELVATCQSRATQPNQYGFSSGST